MGYKAYSITLNLVDDSGATLATGATVTAQAGSSSKSLTVNETTYWQTTTTATTLTLTASPLSGYTFSKWTVSWPYVTSQKWWESSAVINPASFTLTTAVTSTIPVTVTLALTKDKEPEPEPSEFPILTYSAAGAVSGVPEAETLTSGIAKRISTLIPQYESDGTTGAQFLNWKDNATGEYYLPFALITLTADKTITANKYEFSPSYYHTTYIFDANGGSGAPDPITCNREEYVRIPASPLPMKSGYGFLGYASSKTSPSYMAPFQLFIYKSGIVQSTSYKLYAIWSNRGASYSYDDNGGEGGPGDIEAAVGEWTSVHSGKPTRDGYTFLSWNDNISGYGTAYSAGDLIQITAGLVLYAQWKKDDEPEPGPGPEPGPTPPSPKTGYIAFSYYSGYIAYHKTSGAVIFS